MQIDTISFGNGKKSLIMIQGLNTRGIKDASVSLAYMYRLFAKEYAVYLFDRRLDIPDGMTVRDMASARACLTCNAYEELHKIQCPVFVIGGQRDKVVGGIASKEIAEKLGCEMYMYDKLGHAAYEEARDFNDRIYSFLIGKENG